MSSSDLLMVIGIVVMAFTAALLGAVDAALLRVSRARAEALPDRDELGEGEQPEEDSQSRRVRKVLERRSLTVNVLFVVVLACHLGIATLVALMVDDAWGRAAVWVAFAVELLVLLVAVGVPRTMALRNINRTAPWAAGVARVLSAVPPLMWLAGGVDAMGRALSSDDSVDPSDISEEELLALTEQAAQSDSIDADEREYIESVIEFGDTVARQVMSPRPDMVAVSNDVRIVDVADVVIANGYSRIPVFVETVDDIVGIAYSKDIMRAQRDGLQGELVSTIMHKPHVVPETKKISTLLNEMQAESFHMAIVVDEHGGTAGLLTMEDLIEELVGEIVDEFDVEQPLIEQLETNDLLVNGKAELDELGDLLGTELPEGPWSTVGGLIFSTLGHVPEVGETLDTHGHRFLVRAMDGRRIARVLVSPLEAEPAATGEAAADIDLQSDDGRVTK